MLSNASNIVARASRCFQPTVLALNARAMSSTGQEGVHAHSGASLPADADVAAAKDGEPQFHGSGAPLDVGEDPMRSDSVHGHSGTSVPQDADIKAAKEGEPQFLGSGEPLDVTTVANEDTTTRMGTGNV